MEITVISEFIANIGFPIFVAVIMIQNNKQSNDAYLKLYYELKDTIDSNTRANEELAATFRERNN